MIQSDFFLKDNKRKKKDTIFPYGILFLTPGIDEIKNAREQSFVSNLRGNEQREHENLSFLKSLSIS